MKTVTHEYAIGEPFNKRLWRSLKGFLLIMVLISVFNFRNGVTSVNLFSLAVMFLIVLAQALIKASQLRYTLNRLTYDSNQVTINYFDKDTPKEIALKWIDFNIYIDTFQLNRSYLLKMSDSGKFSIKIYAGTSEDLKNDEIKVLFKELNERKNQPLTTAISNGS